MYFKLQRFYGPFNYTLYSERVETKKQYRADISKVLKVIDSGTLRWGAILGETTSR